MPNFRDKVQQRISDLPPDRPEEPDSISINNITQERKNKTALNQMTPVVETDNEVSISHTGKTD